MRLFATRRLNAAATHLCISGLVAALVSVIVFKVWYPGPYASIAGGLGLFGIVIAVDLVLGPLLTLVAASPAKPRRELAIDLCLIAMVQLAGLAYGVYTMAQARPVHLAFEVDRFRVLTAADFDDKALAEAPPALRELPWAGPTLIAAPKPTDPNEQVRSMELGLAGFDLSMVPRYWAEYAPNARAAWAKARPVDRLVAKYPEVQPALADHAAEAGRPPAELRFLPVMSRRASWVALLADEGQRVVGFLPVDGFF